MLFLNLNSLLLYRYRPRRIELPATGHLLFRTALKRFDWVRELIFQIKKWFHCLFLNGYVNDIIFHQTKEQTLKHLFECTVSDS